MKKEYYLENHRGYCGNSLMWWAVNSCGYTTDLSCAKVWTEEEMNEKVAEGLRECDIFWLKSDIDPLTQQHIDFQDLKKITMATTLKNRTQKGGIYNDHLTTTTRKS